MAEVTQAVEQAAQYVLENSRRSNASLNDDQRDADTVALMKAYRDIITKALASGHLDSTIAARHRTEAVKPLVEAASFLLWMKDSNRPVGDANEGWEQLRAALRSVQS